MNSKQAKRIRQAMRDAGLDPRQKKYVWMKHKRADGSETKQLLLDQDQGRFAYKFFKKAVRKATNGVVDPGMFSDIYNGSMAFINQAESFISPEAVANKDREVARKAYGDLH